MKNSGVGGALQLRAGLLAAAICALAALSLGLAGAAQAAPKGSFFIGSPTASGTTGGLFDEARDVAVNETTGDVYVVDRGNHRVQRFSAAGTFERAWGWNVITSSPTGGSTDLGDVFEICTVAVDCQAGVPAAGGQGGRLASPTGIAIDQDDGSVYVWNNGRFRIEKFTADGDFVLTFGKDVNQTTGGDVCTAASGDVCTSGVAGGGAAQLADAGSATGALAVHPTTGDVFVADPGLRTGITDGRRVLHFQADGDFVRAWGWNVAPNGAPEDVGDAFEICTTLCQAGAVIGTTDPFEPGLLHPGDPASLAITSDGILYAVDDRATIAYEFQRFDTSSSTPAGLLLPFLPNDLPSVQRGLEYDADDDRFLVPTIDSEAGGIFEIDADTLAVGPRHLAGQVPNNISGFGLNGATDVEYLSRDDAVLVLNEAGAPPASAVINPASDIQAHSAELSGEVTPGGPEGISVSYRFEIRKGLDGDWVPLGPFTDVGSGTTPVPVSDTATGLEANASYQARIVATKQYDNATVTSALTPVDTPQVPPEAETGPAQHITATSARLRARVNANNLPTKYYFEYGPDTDYDFVEPALPGADIGGGIEQLVVERVGSLDPEAPDALVPGVTYHYRIVAVNEEGTTLGVDRTFTTRATGSEPPPGRAYEMVTPPDKNNRRTTAGLVASPNVGVPSPDGESVIYSVQFSILDPEEGVAFPHTQDWAVIRRQPTGWKAQAVADLPSQITAIGGTNNLAGTSADFEVQAWQHKAFMFESGSALGTKVFGDTGGTIPGSGWYDWIVDPKIVATLPTATGDQALIDDAGARMLRVGGSGLSYRGLLGEADPSSDNYPDEQQLITVRSANGNQPAGGTFTLTFDGQTTAVTGSNSSAAVIDARLEALSNIGPGDVVVTGNQGSPWTVTFTGALAGVDVPTIVLNGGSVTGTAPLIRQVEVLRNGIPSAPADAFTSLPGQPGGDAVYLQEPVGSGAKVLVNECTGTTGGGDATLVPSRDPNGTPGTFGDDLVSAQPCQDGSITSPRGASIGGGGGATPVSGPRRRAMSTDGARVFFMSPDPSASGVPIATCADNDGGAATDCAPQLFVRQTSSTGEPTVRWISRSTIAGQNIVKLAPTIFEGAAADGQSVYFRTQGRLVSSDPDGGLAATAAPNNSSWDLYRYELPGDRDTEPGGGTLTRISGGPGSGTADPNVHAGGSNDAVLRHLSDDGQRAYFVTRGAIGAGGDSWNQPPAGGTTTAGGTASTNATRNLYLFDGTESGDARWKFIARLPHGESGIDACATGRSGSGMPQTDDTVRGAVPCVHGTPDGSAIVFETTAQLTGDDEDTSGDIYLYEADGHSLTRVTASSTDTGYVCHAASDGRCNGTLGTSSGASSDATGLNGVQNANLAIRDDELSVFFESRLPLTDDDVNGDRMDVFEWRAGELTLISPGDSNDDSYFSGASRDGRDVFFFTSKRIDPREIEDGDFDVYDARIGGGFPLPPPHQRCDVLGDHCQGAGPGGVGGQIGSDRLDGDGDAVDPRNDLSVKRPGRAALRKAARTGVLRLRVGAAGPGLVKAAAKARLGRRSRTVARGSKRASKTGPVTIRLRFTKAARKQLRRTGRLKVSVTVTQPGAHARSIKLQLKGGRR